jgi:hypothetical protein
MRLFIVSLCLILVLCAPSSCTAKCYTCKNRCCQRSAYQHLERQRVYSRSQQSMSDLQVRLPDNANNAAYKACYYEKGTGQYAGSSLHYDKAAAERFCLNWFELHGGACSVQSASEDCPK